MFTVYLAFCLNACLMQTGISHSWFLMQAFSASFYYWCVSISYRYCIFDNSFFWTRRNWIILCWQPKLCFQIGFFVFSLRVGSECQILLLMCRHEDRGQLFCTFISGKTLNLNYPLLTNGTQGKRAFHRGAAEQRRELANPANSTSLTRCGILPCHRSESIPLTRCAFAVGVCDLDFPADSRIRL